MSAELRRRSSARHSVRPAKVVVIGYLSLVAVGTVLLLLPASASPAVIAAAQERGNPDMPISLAEALFTATSAVSLTGLITVDTATHWSVLGKAIILTLIQLGGIGFMTLASLFGLFLTGRLGINLRASARAEGRGIDMGEVSWVVRATIIFTLMVEFIVATSLSLCFYLNYDYSWTRALGSGVFHAISAFNNAGFALYSDNVISFQSDYWILISLSGAIVIGGLGFPVLLEMWRRIKGKLLCRTGAAPSRRWSLTARFTLWATPILVALGGVMVAVGEWHGTLRHLSVKDKLLNSLFAGISPRTAGFNALDYADFHPSTLLGTDLLMFVGGGSGGTAGGVKITTAAVILAAVIAEIRGDASVAVARRRLNPKIVRQALVILAFGVGQVMAAVLVISFVAPQFSTDQILFEVTSAFATVGLSTGITPELPLGAQSILILLMFTGRVGPILLATALAARSRKRVFEYPEERPFIG